MRRRLTDATFDNTNFNGAVYDVTTLWPAGFDPSSAVLGGVPTGMDFSDTDFPIDTFRRSLDLFGSNLDRAVLRQPKADSVDLRTASLIGTDLTGATFSRTRLTAARLMSATLDGAVLTETDLSEADMTDSVTYGVGSVLPQRRPRQRRLIVVSATDHVKSWAVTLGLRVLSCPLGEF